MSKTFISALLALSALLTSCARDPNQEKADYLNSGNKYLEARKYQEAVIQFRNAIRIDGKFAAAHNQLGRALLAQGNSEAAFREFSTTVDLDPANAEARLILAKLQLGRRQYAAAQAALQPVLGADPKNAEAHTILGQKYVLTRNLPDAIAEFTKVSELDPGAVGSYAALGAAYMAAGRASDAETAYRKATEANPKSVDARVALGEFYFSQGKLKEAEAELRTACDLDSSKVIPWLFLARTFVAEGRSGDAEKTYIKLKSLAADDPRAYQALGVFYSDTGQKERALAEFRSLAATKPKDSLVRARLIEALIDMNRIDEAAPLIQSVLGAGWDKDKNNGSGDPRIMVSYGRVLIARARYPEAIAVLEKVTAAGPNSASGHYYLGVAQKAAGLPAQAKSSFSRALDLAPEMGQAAAALATLDVKEGNRNEALKQADRAIGSNPDLSQGYVAKGRALVAKGDTAEGARALEEALRRDPVNLSALAALLNLSISQGRTAEAVERINALLRNNQENAGLHFLAALGEFSLKDPDKAEASVKKAIEIDPRTPQVWTLMANIDFSRNQPGKAKDDLRKAIAASPGRVSNYTALGTQYEKENNWEEAKSLFEKAHDLDRNSPWVAAELAFIYLEHGGDPNLALSLAQLARQEMPKSPVTADVLGWAYYKVGSADLAVKQLEESVQITPTNAVYQYHLGMAYASARRWDKAARSLRAALRDDSGFPYTAAARATLAQIQSQTR